MLTADWPRVFGIAAELDKAVEIDAYPDRQDLNIGLRPELGSGLAAEVGPHQTSRWRLLGVVSGTVRVDILEAPFQ